MFYTSVQGTWDKERNRSRAQFGGNNKYIYNHFNEFARALVSSGFDINKTAEVEFRVNDQGGVDSISLNKKIGANYDKTIIDIISSMNGKWRPGEINGIKQTEIITIWVHIYQGISLKNDLRGYLIDGEKYYMEQKYAKALKEINKALIYDELNSRAVELKARILIDMNKKEEACKLLETYKKYQIFELDNLHHINCKN